jgi:hypothetical protein
MRTPNLGSVGYSPNDVPADTAQLQRYLREELAKVSAAIEAIANGFAPVVYAAPAKPRAGMLRNADGTTWNPGSGAGLYRYDGTNWNFLG